MVTGVIQAFDSETISKPGKRPFTVHKVCVDGMWYEAGYTKPAFGIGEQVNFEAEKKYGKMAITSTINRGAGGGSAPAPSAPPASSGGGGGGRSYGGVAKEFPVPALHPDRSIIRQNALAHATKLVCDAGVIEAGDNLDDWAETIVGLAYKFEEYATGQREVAFLKEVEG
jgi:hypothetical protein